MTQQLLHKVFDEGIRQWLVVVFNRFLATGHNEADAYSQTVDLANKTFGNWKAN